VGVATFRIGTMKLLRQGPRPFKWGFDFGSEKFTFERYILRLMYPLQLKLWSNKPDNFIG